MASCEYTEKTWTNSQNGVESEKEKRKIAVFLSRLSFLCLSSLFTVKRGDGSLIEIPTV